MQNPMFRSTVVSPLVAREDKTDIDLLSKAKSKENFNYQFDDLKYFDNRGVWIVQDEESLNAVLIQMKVALKVFEKWNQREVNELVNNVSKYLETYHTHLASIDCEETQCGNIQHKVMKNHYANSVVAGMYAQTKTVGEVQSDAKSGVKHYADPMGIIAACVPFTNASATTLFKAILCLKTRNIALFSPTANCMKTVYEVCALLCEAIQSSGGPAGLIGVLQPKKGCKLLQPMLDHPGIDFIFATGGRSMVKKAYSSGKPALGVGAGNVPVIIDSQSNISEALEYVAMSKTFDNGMLCMSEDVLIVHTSVYDEIVELMNAPGSVYHLLEKEEDVQKINDVLRGKEGFNNMKVIGKNAQIVAKEAGVEINPDAQIIVGSFDRVDKSNNWMWEKMCPVLGLIKYTTEDEAFDLALSILNNDGLGHSVIIHTNHFLKNKSLGVNLERAAQTFPVGRVTVNQPGCFGTVGGMMNFGIPATMSIGCGTWGGNSSSDNIGPRHLLNFKVVTKCASDLNCVRKAAPALRNPKIMVRAAMEVWCVCLELLHADEVSELSILHDAETLASAMDCFWKSHRFLGKVANDPMLLLDRETTDDFAGVLDNYHRYRAHRIGHGKESRLHCDEIRAISYVINISFGYLLFLMFPMVLLKNPYLPSWAGVSKIVRVDIGKDGYEIAQLIDGWIVKLLKCPELLAGAVPDPRSELGGLDRPHIRRVQGARQNYKLCDMFLTEIINPMLLRSSVTTSTCDREE